MTATARAIEITQIAAQAASDKQAENIIALDVSEPLALTDVFLIASSRNERQTGAIADEITTDRIDRPIIRRGGQRPLGDDYTVES